MNPFPTRNDELLQAALDGEMSPEERIEFEQWLEGDARARERFESMQRLTSMVDDVGLVAVPPDLAAATVREISLRKARDVRNEGSARGGRAMARKTMIGLAAAAAVVLVTFSITGYPPIGQGTEGTIGQANRYQSAQPQLSASDVKLGETAVQEFLQSDVFDRLMKDENARKLLADSSVRAMLADGALTQLLKDQGVARALDDDAI
jgi:hypothetical protein